MRRLGLLDDDVKIGENDHYTFYETSWTQDLTDEARRMDVRGIELRGWRVVVAQSKEDPSDRQFVIFDSDGVPIRAAMGAESMSWEIQMIKLSMSYDNDIVEMAERINIEKKIEEEEAEERWSSD